MSLAAGRHVLLVWLYTFAQGREVSLCHARSKGETVEAKLYPHWDSPEWLYRLQAERPHRAAEQQQMYSRRVSHCVAKFFSVTRKSPTSACRPSMSSTRRVRSMRLANRSLGGAVAVAAAVESGAAAAGEAAAAAVVAGAAGAGDVAPSAKRHTSSKHNTKPQPVHYELAGAQLWLCPPNGAPVTIRLQCLARVNSRGVHSPSAGTPLVWSDCGGASPPSAYRPGARQMERHRRG
jgi:hypothetical protein